VIPDEEKGLNEKGGGRTATSSQQKTGPGEPG